MESLLLATLRHRGSADWASSLRDVIARGGCEVRAADGLPGRGPGAWEAGPEDYGSVRSVFVGAGTQQLLVVKAFQEGALFAPTKAARCLARAPAAALSAAEGLTL